MVAGGVAFMPSLLAACGGDDDGTTTGTGSDGTADLGGGGDPNKLVVSNWPAYIDPTEGGVTGSVDLFREETDIDLRYTEDYNDNNEFFAEIQPVLAAGDVLDQDIIVPSYWMASRLRTLEWLDPLPLDEVPNAANLEPDLRNPVWDPDGTFTLPWQGYITGIAYNRDRARAPDDGRSARPRVQGQDRVPPRDAGHDRAVPRLDREGPRDRHVRRRDRGVRHRRAGDERRSGPPVHGQRLHG
jgi:spermidine/putrescine-binding protein